MAASFWQRKEINLSLTERVIIESFNSKVNAKLYLIRYNYMLYITSCESLEEWIDKSFKRNTVNYLYLNNLFEFIKNKEIYSVKELLKITKEFELECQEKQWINKKIIMKIINL